MPLAEITFFAQKKCYLSEQRRHFSGQNGVFVGRCRLCGGWGGRCLPFGWKFQSKTDITIRFGVSWQTAALTSTNESLGSDDSVFFFSRCFAAKTGNITGYRCCPGGRKELLVVVHSGYNLVHSVVRCSHLRHNVVLVNLEQWCFVETVAIFLGMGAASVIALVPVSSSSYSSICRLLFPREVLIMFLHDRPQNNGESPQLVNIRIARPSLVAHDFNK